MIYYDRMDVSEGIEVNKTSKSKECSICHCWHFLGKGFKFQADIWNCYHDVLRMSMNLSNIAILNIQGVESYYIMGGISKNEAIKLLQNVNLTEKVEHYKK